MRWVGAADVERRLSPREAMAAISEALREHQAGRAGATQRFIDRSTQTPLALMPGHFLDTVGLKAITLVEQNPARGLPSIQGLVVLFDQDEGRLLGAVDGPSLTAIRTAAIAGFATDTLAAPEARRMLLVGAGAQGPKQVEAVLAVREIRRLTIWNRSPEKARALAGLVAARHPGLVVEVAPELSSAAHDADVITLATAAALPLIDLGDVKSQCHINAMGSYRPDRRELGSALVAAARLYADTVEGCLTEAGDLMIPIAEGRLSAADVHPLATARRNPDHPLTIMKSVGSAIFDLACARRLLQGPGDDREDELTPSAGAQLGLELPA
ncbi:MAG: ornithine cyclodeaminase family protein [Candidatus Dormibacteria bacterium]